MRIQLRREKGWRKPAGAVVVARPTKYGNPFTTRRAIEAELTSDRAEAQALCTWAYGEWLAATPGSIWSIIASDDGRRREVLLGIEALRGKDLACWCPLWDPAGKRVPCHADILLLAANEGLEIPRTRQEAEAA